MNRTDASIWSEVLPQVRQVKPSGGSCRLSTGISLELNCPDGRIRRAALRWRSSLPAGPSPTRLRIFVAPRETAHPQGYVLHVEPERIDLIGGSAAGCFYGLMTLREGTQAVARRMNVRRHAEDLELPCVCLRDWPDFTTRGFLLDVSRGRVPTLAMLIELAGRLCAWKINQLQLYIEHAFEFSFDPGICRPGEGLHPDEILALDIWCRERYIDLVPAVATFGHMGRILSMPQYRHLAAVEAEADWEATPWPARARGLTLDCTNPQSLRLVKRMWGEVLDAFSSRTVNVCGDEPWDLGKGRTQQTCARLGKSVVYARHLLRTMDIVRRSGRRPQMWSDVIRRHPHLIQHLLHGSTLLHWGYDETAPYNSTNAFTREGCETFVCPGTSGWKRVLSAMNLAECNIRTFAQTGLACGATGLINTDWGDHGHFNMPACSWHGAALGAALSWRVDHPKGVPFDDRLASALLGCDSGRGFALLRAAARPLERFETWRLLWQPIEQIRCENQLPAQDELDEAVQTSRAACAWWKQAQAGARHPLDVRELQLACRFNELAARKLRAMAAPMTQRTEHDAQPISVRTWKEELFEAASEYAQCWHERSKPGGLEPIQRALVSAASDLEQWVEP